MSMWHRTVTTILKGNQKSNQAKCNPRIVGEKSFFFSTFATSYILPFTYLNTRYTL